MNNKTPKKILLCGVFAISLALTQARSSALDLPVAPGPFSGTMASLTNYTCPEWFRDAKFGIWAHWGPQAVPMEGDWYARKMYEQGSPDYNDHLARFGHPSTNGWKDIIPLWKAENWNPGRLMALYKLAGARYFVSMGTHHDDFFLWNSPLHKWNSVNYGPHRDVVALWQKAAQEQGLPFGVSEHLGASFTWFQDAHKADLTGPLAGVPYDGANSNNWDLYHFPAKRGDTGWYSNDPRWQQQWYDEIKELVDDYHPDLLYSDGAVPFGNEVGLSQIANLYNVSAAAHGGRNMAVYNCKQPSGGRWVQDFERGVNGGINPYPWQTDTSIGDWFYNRHWKYQPLSWTVHMLVDIVSKNGNLLLNVVLRPDGTLDPEVETMLHRLADWTAVNGEAIYGSRPWVTAGEGPVRAKGGMFKEDFHYTARDIRFTTKGRILYAIALGWPDEGELTIKSLAKTGDSGQNQIDRIELLGYRGKLTFTQTTNGLVVELPREKLSDLTCSLKITGRNLKPVPLADEVATVTPDSNGNLVLAADTVELHGDRIQTESLDGQQSIGYWDNPGDWADWRVKINNPGIYNVSAVVSTMFPDAELAIEAGRNTLVKKIPQTVGWNKFQTCEMGRVTFTQPGEISVKVRAADAGNWKAVNLRSLKFTQE
jgi:alpha-L-fucosidase